MHTLLFMNIGTPEMMLIMFIALLLFGGKKLPELARGLGKGIREFKDASDSVKTEIHRNINAVNDDLQVDIEAKKREDIGLANPSVDMEAEKHADSELIDPPVSSDTIVKETDIHQKTY